MIYRSWFLGCSEYRKPLSIPEPRRISAQTINVQTTFHTMFGAMVSNISELDVSKQFPWSETFNMELDNSKNESLICGKLQAKQSHCSVEVLSLSLLKASFFSSEHLAWKYEGQSLHKMAALVFRTALLQLAHIGFFCEGPGFSSSS